MAVAGSAASSIGLMLIDSRLVEGAVMLRQGSILCYTADDAWAKLQATGEVYLWLHGDNLQALRVLYAGWVFEQGRVMVGESI